MRSQATSSPSSEMCRRGPPPALQGDKCLAPRRLGPRKLASYFPKWTLYGGVYDFEKHVALGEGIEEKTPGALPRNDHLPVRPHVRARVEVELCGLHGSVDVADPVLAATRRDRRRSDRCLPAEQ